MTPIRFLDRPSSGAMALVVLGLIAYLWFRPPAWVEDLHQTAPAVSWQTTDGLQRLADLSGKVVLVNFWGTWCPFCRIEMPAMQAFYSDWRERGFEIVAFSIDEDHAVADAYMRSEDSPFLPRRLMPTPAAPSAGWSRFRRRSSSIAKG